MSQNTDYHVWKDNGRWYVKRENAERASSSHDNKQQAVKRAKELADRAGGIVKPHNPATGQFEQKPR